MDMRNRCHQRFSGKCPSPQQAAGYSAEIKGNLYGSSIELILISQIIIEIHRDIQGGAHNE